MSQPKKVIAQLLRRRIFSLIFGLVLLLVVFMAYQVIINRQQKLPKLTGCNGIVPNSGKDDDKDGQDDACDGYIGPL